MDRYWQANVATEPPGTPSENPGGFPANGNPVVGVPGTVPGEWWYHAVTEELRNATIALGASPDFTKTDQLATALLVALAHVAVSINYDDLIGKPELAAVATSGDFADLSGTPEPYELPAATASTLGGIKAGAGTTIAADGTLSALGTVRTVNDQAPDTRGNCVVQAVNTAAPVPGQVSLINQGGATSGSIVLKLLKPGAAIALTDVPSGIQMDVTPATHVALGAVKPGAGVSVAADGTLSTDPSLIIDVTPVAAVTLDLTPLASGIPEIIFNLQPVAPVTTLTFANAPAAGVMALFVVVVSNVAGASLTWPASVRWPNGSAPTLTGVAAQTDTFVVYTQNGGASYYGFVAGQNQ